ncbi:PhzF family phenazine biosynthesis protein [Chromobacterium vaccinii]|uniref:Phenazine biosynthesis protein n=1 Tax=Chromobacterium vaccinii TaxID=1108595 RepID=A0A1D9LJZ6_9NEIS|nr:PhzF family phenazine biosynthesis protein [Chromobacterium vaccinii]AOZ51650.1 phenazine biosynthesis protein [Chromobacterium vaccinii]QND86905.1 Phenazine biosynthesis protein PhzF [Chromobacterium vaccinii]QND92136.1 Phenazine biosynthesis protein PhzF [Chromobacterium vaccinii]
MGAYRFQIVNVFAEQRFGGNPLAVFTDAAGLSDDDMQLIARQFNLSETAFLLPGDADCVASLRIFTPGSELLFGGHPTLGCAAVLHARGELGDDFTLRTRSGLIPIRHVDGVFRLRALPASVRSGCSAGEAAAMLGLAEGDVRHAPQWVDAGSEQLLIGLSSREAVLRAKPDPALFARHAAGCPGNGVAYVWHQDGGVATVRLFFEQDGAVLEDPGTGSACANLGGWCALNGLAPLSWRVEQGEAMGRSCVLYLDVDAAGSIAVGGRVKFLGEGELRC